MADVLLRGMGRPGRRRCPRCISHLPDATLFRPVGVHMGYLEKVTLSFDELEVLRLVDLEGISQEKAAEFMCVSRRTLNNDLRNARRKVAEALSQGKLIEIRGENYIFLNPDKKTGLEQMSLKNRKGGDEMKRLVIPIVGTTDKIEGHFGRAQNYAIVDIDENGNIVKKEVASNTSEHFGGAGLPPDIMLSFNPDAVVVYGMGPRAIQKFVEKGVPVLTGNVSTVQQAVEAFVKGELVPLTKDPYHAGGHHHG